MLPTYTSYIIIYIKYLSMTLNTKFMNCTYRFVEQISGRYDFKNPTAYFHQSG